MQAALETLHRLYAFYDQFNLSMTAWIAIAVICLVAMLFAARELLGWFFKIDDLKKDLARLHELSQNLESEMRTLQAVIYKDRQVTGPTAAAASVPSADVGPTLLAIKATEKSAAFPITH